MRVFVYFTYEEYHSIRKWMQRHQEYEGVIFSNDGFYIAKFDIDATDPQKVAYFFNYFSHKDVEIFKPKMLDPWKVLRQFAIVSLRPFIAVAKSQDQGHIPGKGEKASEGILENVHAGETHHDDSSSHPFLQKAEASGQHSPNSRDPSLGTGEEKSSPSILDKGVKADA